MKGFRRKVPLAEVESILLDQVALLGTEEVDLRASHLRVLAEEVLSDVALPPFDRSAMDGYAVRVSDLEQASETSPVKLELVGEVVAGEVGEMTVVEGQAVRIMTGAPIPSGADAVVKVEETRESDGIVQVMISLPPGKNIARRGEDVEPGDRVLSPRTLLLAQHVSVLAGLRRIRIRVQQRPTVALLISGDELVAAGSDQEPGPGQIMETNSYLLEGLVRRWGGVPVIKPIVRDSIEAVRRAVNGCEEDILVTTGGSSVGTRDFFPAMAEEWGEVLAHGIDMRPGSPTGLAVNGSRWLFLLPGNPVAAAVAADCFLRPTIRLMQGLDPSRDSHYRMVEGRLSKWIPSRGGATFVRVRVKDGAVHPVMVGGSAILTSMTSADGFLIIPPDSEGLSAAAEVTVYLY